MNFKRGRPKNRRAGCLFCKPHKANGASSLTCNQTPQEQRARITDREAVSDVLQLEELQAEFRDQEEHETMRFLSDDVE